MLALRLPDFGSLLRSVRRHSLWFAMLAVLAILFRQVLLDVIKLSLSVDHYSHLIFIPCLSAFLLYRQRQDIFSHTALDRGFGVALAFLAVPALIFGSRASGTGEANGYLFARGLTLFVLVLVSFMFCYGARAFRSAAFPLLFLFLAVPFPAQVVQEIIVFLQKGSAAVCDVMFSLTGVPFLRRGDVFYLPNLTIEIAPQCSGIRSSMALLVTTLLAVHLLMQRWWKKALVVVSIVPLVLVKNGLRIVTISLLGVYVDPRFLSGWLHHSGGIVFFSLTLAIIAVLIRLLEPNSARSRQATAAGAAS